jgi:hypothetical protein
MPTMKVNFDNTQENWCLWGKLVGLWVRGLHPKPLDTKQLLDQMKAFDIKGASIPGPPRSIFFTHYADFWFSRKVRAACQQLRQVNS